MLSLLSVLYHSLKRTGLSGLPTEYHIDALDDIILMGADVRESESSLDQMNKDFT